VRQLGRGQYGTAHLVVKDDVELVAKVVLLDNLKDRDKALALQEVDILRRLQHPNIVRHCESWLHQSTVQFEFKEALVSVMEYCAGGDLRAWLHAHVQSGEFLAEDIVLRLFVQMLFGLRYIHSMHILHRDLKTSNMLLNKEFSMIKIGDFGIARVLESTTAVAVTMLGTPYYMSPEVCKGEPYREKSDVWSLGCILYEMCMLRHAFQSQSLLGLVYCIVSERVEPLPSGRYSDAMGELVTWLLSKSADDRPTPDEVLLSPALLQYSNEVENHELVLSTSKLYGGGLHLPRVQKLEADSPQHQLPPPPPPPGPPPKDCRQLPMQQTLEGFLTVKPPAKKAAGQPRPPSDPPPPPASPPPHGTAELFRAAAPALRKPAPPPGRPLAASRTLRATGDASLRSRTPGDDDTDAQQLHEVAVLLYKIRNSLLRRRRGNWVQAFALHDTTGHGVLGRQQFESFLISLGLCLSLHEVQLVTASLVGVHSTVSLAHFSEAMHSSDEHKLSQEEQQAQELLRAQSIGDDTGARALAESPTEVLARLGVSRPQRVQLWVPKHLEGYIDWTEAKSWCRVRRRV